MLLKAKIKLFVFLYLTWFALTGITPVIYAQQVTIELGPNRLPINEYFTISIRLRNLPVQTMGDFPEIEGFKKSARTNTTSKIGLGSKTIIEQTITQNYAAFQEGKFPLNPFFILVNGRKVASRGTVIIVEPMAAENEGPVLEPEEPLPPPTPVQAFKSQSFLSIEADKDKVYVGEGFYLRLAFYLLEAEQEQLDFYNFGQQFPELVKQMRQKDTWEEAVEAPTEIIPDTLLINGKSFLKFTLYRRVFYPLNNKAIVFNPVSLVMSRRPEPETYAAPNASAPPTELVTFTSRPKNIQVRSLPPHPLRELVPVGQYRLQEGIDRTTFKTGQSFTYRFNVVGEGNLATLTPPVTPRVNGLEIYPPEIRLTLNKVPGVVQGTKSFRYVLLAQAAGEYPLNKTFRLIYFNTTTQTYDTLQSGLTIQVKGREKGLAITNPENIDPFYRLIGEEENQLVDLNQEGEIKFYTNVVILSLICISLFLFYKRK